jgi:hypothetical protein
MTVRKTQQDWSIGSVVQAGFMQVRILGCRAEYDGMPDIYTVENLQGTKFYELIPHRGIHPISKAQADSNIKLQNAFDYVLDRLNVETELAQFNRLFEQLHELYQNLSPQAKQSLALSEDRIESHPFDR